MTSLGTALLLVAITHAQAMDVLYDWSEPITQLHVTNFTQYVLNSDTAWVVEFYSSWCGHCQRFAPIWSAFAQDIEDWSDVIQVAAIPCSEPTSSPICRHYVISGYPTIMFFPPRASIRFPGHRLHRISTVGRLRRGTLAYLRGLQDAGNAPLHWPRLEPYNSLLSLERAAIANKLVFLVAENLTDAERDHHIGQEIQMDVSPHDVVVVGRVDSALLLNRTQCSCFEEISDDDYPVLFHLPSDGIPVYIAHNESRAGLVDALLRRVGELNSTMVMSEESEELEESGSGRLLPKKPQRVRKHGGLHMQDLESGLYYTLYMEIASHAFMTGEEYRALTDFIHLMSEYFPGNDYTVEYLHKLDDWLDESELGVTGHMWLRHLNSLKTEDAYVPEEIRWTGCEGSRPRFRGYPCSLWMTFHALSVSAYEQNSEDAGVPAVEVVRRIRNYVQYFLGCRDCAEHFYNASMTFDSDVRDREDAVLYLWQLHNLANARLQGDHTEDPTYPKMQFPSVRDCPSCRVDISRPSGSRNGTAVMEEAAASGLVAWDRMAVFEYLRRFYGKDSIIDDLIREDETKDDDEHRDDDRDDDADDDREESDGHEHDEGDDGDERDNDDDDQDEGDDDDQDEGDDDDQDVGDDDDQDEGDEDEQEVDGRRRRRGGAGRRRGGNRRRQSCDLRQTGWSPCSVTCGVGVSRRMSNNNTRCLLRSEQRLCNIRPCDLAEYGGSDCQPEVHAPLPTPFTYDDCSSLQAHHWHFCNICAHTCCHPLNVTTVTLPFQCSGSDKSSMLKVMTIQTCECNTRCP